MSNLEFWRFKNAQSFLKGNFRASLLKMNQLMMQAFHVAKFKKKKWTNIQKSLVTGGKG